MWKIRPNFSHLYSPIMSRVKYSTNYVKREKFNDILHCYGKIDLIRTLWHIGQKTSHEKNATEFLTPLFTENVSPVWHLTKLGQVSNILSNSSESWYIRQNTPHVKNPTEFLTPIFAENVKYPTKYIKREEFDRILHRCEQLDLIRLSYDIFDRIHHMWKIRPNFSHLYSPIRPRVRCLTD